MSAAVQIEDRGMQRMQEYLRFLKGLKLRVGYQQETGKERHPDAPHLAVAHLAAIHEFGSDKVPEQAFIRRTIRDQQREIEAFEEREIAAGLRRVVQSGADPRRAAVEAFSRVGSFVLGLIRARMANARTADGEQALDETGTLARNLTWRVSSGRETFAKGSR